MREKKVSLAALVGAAAVLAVAALPALAVDTTYTVTDLGQTTFTGITWALNNKGQALLDRDVNGVRQTHLYDSGTFTPVRQLAGLGSSVAVDARGLNLAGDIAGVYGNTPFVLKSNGTRIDMGNFGGASSLATALNNLGEVVGNSATPNLFQGNPVRHAFSFRDLNGNNAADPGEMVDLGAFVENGESFARDVNDAGVIVGSAEFEVANGHEDAYRWTNHVGQNLNIGDGGHENAKGVNEAGVIVGQWNPLSSSTWRGFVYRPGTGFQDLGFAGTNTRVGANDINEHGLVVGETNDVGFVWDAAAGGAVQDLGDLLAPGHTQWHIDAAFQINDEGRILGRGRLGTSDYHYVLLTPVPEPAAAAAAVVLVPALAIRRRRGREA